MRVEISSTQCSAAISAELERAGAERSPRGGWFLDNQSPIYRRFFGFAPPDRPTGRIKPPQPEPEAIENWPQWARDIAEARTPEDRGLGDTAARIADCDCAARRDRWNAMFPYPKV